MNVSCHCIANVDGECAAEICKGAIVGLDINISSPEQAERLYEVAATMFEEEFPRN